MVIVYRHSFGLVPFAVSETEETAIQGLYDKFASETDKNFMTPQEWWEDGRKYNNGAPPNYEIKPIDTI